MSKSTFRPEDDFCEAALAHGAEPQIFNLSLGSRGATNFAFGKIALREQKSIPYSLRSICLWQIDSALRNVLAQIENLRQHALRPEISRRKFQQKL